MLLLTLLAATLAACGGSSDDTNHDSTMTTHPSTSGGHGGHGAPHRDTSATGAPAALLEFRSEPAVIEPGKPATWHIRTINATTGKPIEELAINHEKLMHLLVISTDLAWFNHIHPEHVGDGKFTVRTTLPSAGVYRIYADITPKGGTQLFAQTQVVAGTDGNVATSVLPVVDTAGAGGWIVRRVASHPEGEPGAIGGDEYEVAMMPMPTKLEAGVESMLHFQIRDARGRALTDLEPYLGAMGHAVVLSTDMKTMLHTHPMDAGEHAGDSAKHAHGSAKTGRSTSSGSADVIFHTTFPAAGLYKVWGQFQHKGRIITAPFVLRVS